MKTEKVLSNFFLGTLLLTLTVQWIQQHVTMSEQPIKRFPVTVCEWKIKIVHGQRVPNISCRPLFWPFQGRLSQPASYTNNASGNNIFKLGGREWYNAKSSTFCPYLWVKKTLEVRRNSTFVGDRKANKYSGPISVRIWKKQFQKMLNSVLTIAKLDIFHATLTFTSPRVSYVRVTRPCES